MPLILDDKLDRLIDIMPDSVHKIRIMQASHALAKQLKLPKVLAYNEKLLVLTAEFMLTFLQGIAFATATKVSKSYKEPNLSMSLTFAALNALAPFLFNLLSNFKRNGMQGTFYMSTNFAASLGSIFTFIATFNQGMKMLGDAPTAAEEVKNCLLVSMATVYSMSPSYTIIKNALDCAGRHFFKPREFYSFDVNAEEDAELKELEQLVIDTQGNAELYFLIVVFVITIVTTNAEAKKFLSDANLSSPFALNSVLLPTSYVIATLIRMIYKMIVKRGL